MQHAAQENLPRCYLITGDAPSANEWWSRFDGLIAQPDPMIQLRLRPAVRNDNDTRVREALVRCRASGARLLVNAAPTLALGLGADGVHLDSRTLMSLDRRPLDGEGLVGASCHDEVELRQAAAIGADFACLSPLHPTPSHPGRPALGYQRFEELARDCAIPVYALGGVGRNDLQAVRAAGGYGVAGISAFWG